MNRNRTFTWRSSLRDLWQRIFGRPLFGPAIISRIASYFRGLIRPKGPSCSISYLPSRFTLTIDPSNGERVFGPDDLEREEGMLEMVRLGKIELAPEKTQVMVYGRQVRIEMIRENNAILAPFEWSVIGCGCTGFVFLMAGRVLNDDGGASVLKRPHNQPEDRGLQRRELEDEYKIYRRIGPHPRLLQMRWGSRWGTCLEHLPNGNLRNYLKAHPGTVQDVRRQWTLDAAEGLHLLHSHGDIHADTSTKNFLVDSQLRLRIADFSGSGLDGSNPTVSVDHRSHAGRDAPGKSPASVKMDLFALGSVIFEIITGARPYEDVPSEDAKRWYEENQFPDVDGVTCGELIRGCWLGHFDSALQVHEAINLDWILSKPPSNASPASVNCVLVPPCSTHISSPELPLQVILNVIHRKPPKEPDVCKQLHQFRVF